MPCFFFVRLRARCSRTSCTFRASFSPSATCSPCFAFGQRFTRDNLSNSDVEKQSTTSVVLFLCQVARVLLVYVRVHCATRAHFSRFSAFALRLTYLFFKRSAPRSRLPRLVRLASRLVNVLQEITFQIQMATTKARHYRAFSCKKC